MVEFNFLFIGGAPRSGTTLLMNLIDNHPNILCFPFEHSTFERFFLKRTDKDYFLNEFIEEMKEGQQAIMSSNANLIGYSKKIENEYKKKFALEVDPDKYLLSYRKFLEGQEFTLRNILIGLTKGLIAGSEFAQRKKSNLKWIVFKQPYYTELFAKQIHQEMPEARFIHINRDPIGRYTSAKKRRLIHTQMLGMRLSHINRVSFVEGHCEVGESSKYLGKSNQISLGDQRYHQLGFEELVEDSINELRSTFQWLNVKSHKSIGSITRLGEPTIAGSLLVQSNTVDSSASCRDKEYFSLTNWNERLLHKFLLEKRHNLLWRTISLVVVLFPFKHSSYKNYVFQLLFIFRLFYINFDTSLRNRLPNGARKGHMFLSGNT